jgi:hypothetical protein
MAIMGLLGRDVDEAFRLTLAAAGRIGIEAFHGFVDSIPGFRAAFERGIVWQERALARLRRYIA